MVPLTSSWPGLGSDERTEAQSFAVGALFIAASPLPTALVHRRPRHEVRPGLPHRSATRKHGRAERPRLFDPASAWASIKIEILRPRALAVLRLTSSTVVLSWIGKSARLASLRIFPTRCRSCGNEKSPGNHERPGLVFLERSQSDRLRERIIAYVRHSVRRALLQWFADNWCPDRKIDPSHPVGAFCRASE